MSIAELESRVLEHIRNGDCLIALRLVGDHLVRNPRDEQVYNLVRTCFKGTDYEEVCNQSPMGAGFSRELQCLLLGSVPGLEFMEGKAETHDCHVPEVIVPASPDLDITPRIAASHKRQLVSTASTVSLIESGHVWFDRFNLTIHDTDGNCVAPLSKANTFIVHAAVARAHKTWYEGDLVVMATRSEHNYYHWMIDLMPKFAILDKYGYDYTDPSVKFLFGRLGAPFHWQSLEELGIDSSRVIQTSEIDGQYIVAHADRLVVPWLDNGFGLKFGSWAAAFLRSTFDASASDRVGERKIFLSRRPEASRNGRVILNNDELESFFVEKGFDIVYPDLYSISQQADMLGTASHVAATHGAALTNVCFCQPGTKVLELFGEYYQSCFWGVSEVCGLEYHSLSCAISPDDPDFQHFFADSITMDSRRQSDLTVPLDRLNDSTFFSPQ